MKLELFGWVVSLKRAKPEMTVRIEWMGGGGITVPATSLDLAALRQWYGMELNACQSDPANHDRFRRLRQIQNLILKAESKRA